MADRFGLPTWMIADVLAECIIEIYEMNPRYVDGCMKSITKAWRDQLSTIEWEQVWDRVTLQLDERGIEVDTNIC